MTDNPYATTSHQHQGAQLAPQYPYAAPPPAPTGGRQWPLAGWGSRVAAYLVDMLLALVGAIPVVIGAVLLAAGAPGQGVDPASGQMVTDGTGNGPLAGVGVALMVLGYLLVLGIQIWNRCFKQGRTGQSVGKKMMGLYLVGERTGNPIGAGMAFVRDLAHVLDGFFYIGYLWPLWDAKRQTFADKLLSTVVAKAPQG